MKAITRYIFILSLIVVAGCARMGTPDGGWYDETPPRVIGTSPADGSTNVKDRRFVIRFNEYIQLDNPTEHVVVSPYQEEAPDIRNLGKHLVIKLNDSLKANTTYTIDFSKAITDLNEDNPLGNYTYTFSTGDVIDSLEVSGYVLDAETLQPVKGILCGMYSNPTDTCFQTCGLERIGKSTDSGRFTVRGLSQQTYSIYALQDMEGDCMYTQPSEKLAFTDKYITPTIATAERQDTVWRDTLHIESISQQSYTRYLPDDIVLLAFTAEQTDRYLIKAERKEADRFKLFFSYGNMEEVKVRGLNFDATNRLLLESTLKKDTLTYWLRDTMLVNQDSLEVELTYLATDSTGVLQNQTDTLLLLPKVPYAKRQKETQKKVAEWEKQQERKKKRGEPYDSIYPATPLPIQMQSKNQMAPDENVILTFNAPLETVKHSGIHLYSKIDTLWYDARFRFEEDVARPRTYIIKAEWRPNIEYSLEIDSATLVDIYGKANSKYKQGIKVKSDDEFGTLLVSVTTEPGANYICQLLDNKPSVKKEVKVVNGQAEFFYIIPGTYYLKLIKDDNDNGKWDTGNYEKRLQPEEVYFYNQPVDCKAKWDVNLTWNPKALPLFKQLPSALRKDETTKKEKKLNRNQERARKLGVTYTPPKNY